MCDRSVVFQAVGDIALGDHPLCAGFGTHSRLRSQPQDFPFRHVQPLFARADILFGNLECTLSDLGLRPRDYHSVQMRGHAAYLGGLKAAGFDVLNHANNHSMQHGAEPFLETVRMLRDAGIEVCGVAVADQTNALPSILERNGLRIALLGYSLRPRQYFTREPLYAEGRPERILQDVRMSRDLADVIVVSLHWGDEFIDRPSPRDIALAHEIIDSGADLIVGHHPHVLRGIEPYGRGHIVYSLGNFVCDMLWQERLRESAVLQCRLSPRGVSDLTMFPIRINDQYQPVPVEGVAAAAILERLEALSARLVAEPAIVPMEAAMEHYAVESDVAHRDERRSAHRYFLRRVREFPPGILLQQIGTWVRNRLAERGLLPAIPSRGR